MFNYISKVEWELFSTVCLHFEDSWFCCPGLFFHLSTQFVHISDDSFCFMPLYHNELCWVGVEVKAP